MRQISALLFPIFCLLVPVRVGAEEEPDTLIFQYEDHPPFLTKQADGVGGLFGKFVNSVGAAAGIDIVWQERAFRRTRRDLHDGVLPFCVAGHTFDADKAEVYHYTPAIGTFGKSGLLVRASDTGDFVTIQSVKALFEETALAGGFIADAKYAVPYRPYLENSKGRHLFVSSSHEKLAELLVRGRIDFVFENELMVDLHKEATDGGDTLTFVTLPDMPAARDAFVKCTKAVDAALLDRLDAAIVAMKKAAPE